jgi:hypothetical protein
MARFHNSIEIKVPVNKVFAYIDNPRNLPDWLPSMLEINNVRGSGLGTHYEWSWKIGDMKFNGESTNIEYVPEKRMVVRSRGKYGAVSKWIYNLKNETDKTILDLEFEYIAPNRALGKSVEKVFMNRNKREVDLGLLNIKKRLEEEA